VIAFVLRDLPAKTAILVDQSGGKSLFPSDT
jgi:hypothetical protein